MIYLILLHSIMAALTIMFYHVNNFKTLRHPREAQMSSHCPSGSASSTAGQMPTEPHGPRSSDWYLERGLPLHGYFPFHSKGKQL